MHEPRFWWRERGLASALLSPLASVYGAIAAGRMRGQGAAAGVPVICVGNFTLGGTGKTPAAIAMAVGVLPLPPSVKLPMQITGRFARTPCARMRRAASAP
jgi:hypothetical protein